MKALVYTGKNSLDYRDEPEPEAGPGEVLVRVDAVGICGSDLHAYHGLDERRPPPLVLGHEAAGRIVGGSRAGERVTVNPLVTCGRCRACREGHSNLCATRQIISMPPRPGAFAEVIRIPETNLVAIPDRLTATDAALAEPLAVAWHAVRRGMGATHRSPATARCLVLGGGAIGLATALVLLRFGAREVHMVEPNPKRRETAAAAGPLLLHDPASEIQVEDGTMDLVFDTVGADATRAVASRAVSPGGCIVHVGLLPGQGGIDVRKLTLQEVTLVGSYCYTHADFVDVVDTLSSGGFGRLNWLEERPLSEGAHAFLDLDAGQVAAAKIVLRP